MNYSSIINALPQDVATRLQEHLYLIDVNANLSKDEALDLFEDAVRKTKVEMVIEDDEKRRLVDSLLSMVGNAGVGLIFG